MLSTVLLLVAVLVLAPLLLCLWPDNPSNGTVHHSGDDGGDEDPELPLAV